MTAQDALSPHRQFRRSAGAGSGLFLRKEQALFVALVILVSLGQDGVMGGGSGAGVQEGIDGADDVSRAAPRCAVGLKTPQQPQECGLIGTRDRGIPRVVQHI